MFLLEFVITAMSVSAQIQIENANANGYRLYSLTGESTTGRNGKFAMALDTTAAAGKISTKSIPFYATTNVLDPVGAPDVPFAVIRGHSLLQSTADLLNHWRCWRFLLITDESLGFSTDMLQDFFGQRQFNSTVRTLGRELRDAIDEEILNDVIASRHVVVMSASGDVSSRLMRWCAAEETALFDVMRTWLVVAEEIPFKRLEHGLLKRYVQNPMSQLNYLLPFGKDPVDEFGIYDVFHSSSSNRVEAVRFAHWNSRRGFQYLTMAQIKSQGEALRGRAVRMMTIKFAPLVILESLKSSRDKDSGYVTHVFDIVEKHLNMRYNMSMPADKTFGMLLLNGTYTGGVGHLHRGETDMWGNVMGTTTTRSKVLRYLTALAYGFITMVINTPDSIVPSTIYIMPFRLSVWVCLLAGLLTILAELALIKALIGSKRVVNGNQSATYLERCIFSSDYLVAMLDNADGISVKVVVSTLLMATLLTFTCYTTLLTSFLTFQEMKLPFKTLLEMSENNEYQVLLVKHSQYHEQFKMAKETDQSFFRVWQKIVREKEKGLVSGFVEGFFQLINSQRQQKYVLISDEPTVNYLDRNYCRVSFTPEKFNKNYVNAAVRKDFPYGNLVSEVLNRLWENGVMSRLKHIYLLSDPARCRPDRQVQSLGFAQLMSPFVFLLCGWMTSLLVVAIEIRIYRRRFEAQRIRI